MRACARNVRHEIRNSLNHSGTLRREVSQNISISYNMAAVRTFTIEGILCLLIPTFNKFRDGEVKISQNKEQRNI
jgi:hypothetical protein